VNSSTKTSLETSTGRCPSRRREKRTGWIDPPKNSHTEWINLLVRPTTGSAFQAFI